MISDNRELGAIDMYMGENVHKQTKQQELHVRFESNAARLYLKNGWRRQQRDFLDTEWHQDRQDLHRQE